MSVQDRVSFEEYVPRRTRAASADRTLGRQSYVITNDGYSAIEPSDASISPSEVSFRHSEDAGVKGFQIFVEPSEVLVLPSEKSNDPLIAQVRNVRNAPTGWPKSPCCVKVSTSSIISDLVTDVVLLALSVAFYIFAITVRYYDQASTSQYPAAKDVLSRLSKYGPTIFPILFAGVLGRASSTIMVWRLERGERIGNLDLLAASTSLTNTVISQARTGSLRLLGFVLIAIWILSPIGGQASLRHVSIGQSILNGSNVFTYMVPTGDLSDVVDANASQAAVDQYFAALFYTSRYGLPATDIWGNVKIPFLEVYEGESTQSSDGWYSVGGNHTEFSSLAGIPISNISAYSSDRSTAYVMYLETSYLYLSCSKLPPVSRADIDALPENLLSTRPVNIWSRDDSALRWLTPPDKLQPRTMVYWDSDRNGTEVYLPECELTTTYLQAEVVCNTSSSCAASRVRRSPSPHNLPLGFTLFDNWKFNSTGWHWVMSNFLKNFQAAKFNQALANTAYNELSVVIPENLEKELSQLLNTYWQCVNTRDYFVNGIPTDTTMLNRQSSSNTRIPMDAFTVIKAASQTRIEVLQAHYAWTIALSAASWTMIIASLVTPLVRYLCIRGPDMMLNFSSMATQNTDQATLPQTGTSLSMSDRARLLQRVKVRFGDVQPDMDVGKLAFSAIDNSSGRAIGYVKKDRLYE